MQTQARSADVIPLPPGVTAFVFYCDMGALDAGQRRRYAELRDWLLEVATVSRLDDGYRFAFAPGAEPLQRTAEFIALERRCCPFLQFRLTVAPAAAAALDLAGPAGVHDFLRAELGFADPLQPRATLP